MPETQIPTDAQTPAEGGPVGSALNFDGLLDKYMPEESATPQPETQAETPNTETDTPPSDPVEGEGDTPAPGEGGAETEVDPEREESKETQPDEELEALLLATEEKPEPDTPKETFLPEFDKVKLLKEHPELEAPYKHMQAAFSRKMADVATKARKADEIRQQAEAMQQDFDAFQESLKDDASFEDFLVQVSLNRPEVMERAYERAVTLNEDEGKKKEYLKERELSEREKKVQEKEKREAAEALQRRTSEIVNLVQRVGKRLGLVTEADFFMAEQLVANQILQNHASTGKRDITPEQIVAQVRRAAKVLEQKKEEGRVVERTSKKKEDLKVAQERVRAQARPAAPRTAAPPAAPAAPTRRSFAPKQSAVDAWLDEQLGVEA